MRKIYVVSCFITLLLVSFLSITYSYEYNENTSLKFEMLGDYKLDLSLYDKYFEYGVKVTYNDNDISSLVNIDSSLVDMNKVGEYKVKYEVNIDNMVEYVYRIVRVTENVKPELTLKGANIIYINVGNEYIDPGYVVTDNYDTDLMDKVIIMSNLDVNTVGTYKIEYRVNDSSGNQASVSRLVIVK